MSAPSGTGIEVSSASEVTTNRPYERLGACMSPLFARRSETVSQNLIQLIECRSFKLR